MIGRGIAIACCVAVLPVAATAQISGYASTAYGHHENPLYNFERISDRINQSYLELQSEKEFGASMLTFRYVSGLMIFNRFAERNYYEHTFTGSYSRGFVHDASSEKSDEESGDDDKGIDDSTGTYLHVGVTMGARHDRNTYKEFDNLGSSFTASGRYAMGDVRYARLSNAFGYRRYTYLPELSNITDELRFDLAWRVPSGSEYGARIGAGMKHYTSSVYDTARFEEQRSYPGKSQGKGKGGAALGGPSSKQILTSHSSNATYQLSAAIYVRKNWNRTALDVEILYRYNPRSTARYLAQYVNSTILSEDIYNDYFSYQGPYAHFTCTQQLPLGMTSTVILDLQRKTFGAPAFDLSGNEVAVNRKDLRSSMDLSLGRTVNLSDGVALEISILSELMRNQSNDDYNDFSSFSISFALGISF